ncbi:MAG: Swt1 family HEPN domain-containing protein [Deltaproteobacteria bacterium]|nr:Swt1 family HEPN domain-containing protein [Deltaproteobacteria bacterium]
MTKYPEFMMFSIHAILIDSEIKTLEKQMGITILKEQVISADEDDYLQFELRFRQEAREMSRHYELIYCLERQIRVWIEETLIAEKGDRWWETSVPEAVQDGAKNNMKKEKEAGVSIRSEKEIDYINFGELGEIVKRNWESFAPIFSDPRAFQKIVNILNQLRSPIAHSCLLSEDEIVRLRLTVRDFFRLMG